MKHFCVLADSLMSLPGVRTHLTHLNLSQDKIKHEMECLICTMKHKIFLINDSFRGSVQNLRENQMLKLRPNFFRDDKVKVLT